MLGHIEGPWTRPREGYRRTRPHRRVRPEVTRGSTATATPRDPGARQRHNTARPAHRTCPRGMRGTLGPPHRRRRDSVEPSRARPGGAPASRPVDGTVLATPGAATP